MMKRGWSGLNRREFLGCGAGGVLVGGGVSSLLTGSARGADGGRNPFAYDVEKYRHTDPALIGYDRVSRFKSPRPEPRRLAVGPGDQLYLAAGGGVLLLDGEGRVTSEMTCGGPVRALVVDGDGTVYVALRDRIEVYDGKGKRQAIWASADGRPFLTGVAVGGESVFVADAGNRMVRRHDRSGGLLGVLGAKDRDRGIPGLVLPSPFLDVEIGGDGLVRVNNPGRHRVELYTPDGVLELWWGKPSMAIEGFCGCCNPVNLALLGDGRVVTFEKGLPRVKVYGATGDFECVVAGPEMFADPATAESITSADERSYGGLDGAVDSAGRIIILDLLGAELHVMQRRSTRSDLPPTRAGKGQA